MKTRTHLRSPGVYFLTRTHMGSTFKNAQTSICLSPVENKKICPVVMNRVPVKTNKKTRIHIHFSKWKQNTDPPQVTPNTHTHLIEFGLLGSTFTDPPNSSDFRIIIFSAQPAAQPATRTGERRAFASEGSQHQAGDPQRLRSAAARPAPPHQEAQAFA